MMQPQQFYQASSSAKSQHVIGDSGFHGGRHAHAGMNSAEVATGKPEHDSGTMVFPFFGIAVFVKRVNRRSPMRSDRLLGYDASASAVRIGFSENWDHLQGLNFCGRIAGFIFLRCAIDLDEHRVSREPIMQRRLATGRG